MSAEADVKLLSMFKYLYDHRDEKFGNARDVRNIFEETIAIQASRLARLGNPSRVELSTIEEHDIRWHPELSPECVNRDEREG